MITEITGWLGSAVGVGGAWPGMAWVAMAGHTWMIA